VSEHKAERIPAAERREQILEAAARVFGERGYAAATTDQVAQAAGISQPYVVRMFGSKEKLFGEVVERAGLRLQEVFRAAIADANERGLGIREKRDHLGRAYIDLVDGGGVLLPLMQSFLLGHDPVLGPKVRSVFVEIYQGLRDEAGLGAEGARDFLAYGMLINTLLTSDLPALYDEDPAARELLDMACGSKVRVVLDAAKARA